MLCGAGLLGIIWGGGTEHDTGEAQKTESPPPPAPEKTAEKPKPAAPAPAPNPDAKLVTEDIVVGTGDTAESGDTLSMKYTGKLLDGTEFDSTTKHGDKPFTFPIGAGRVIKLDIFDRANADTGHQHKRSRDDAADILGLHAQPVSFLQRSRAFVEADHERRAQDQPHQHKQPNFNFRSRFHIKMSVPSGQRCH